MMMRTDIFYLPLSRDTSGAYPMHHKCESCRWQCVAANAAGNGDKGCLPLYLGVSVQ